MSHGDAELRHELAETLRAHRALRSESWRAAVEAVPRPEFLRGGFFQPADPDGATVWRPVLPRTDPGAWRAACHADQTLVTQLDGRTTPSDVTEGPGEVVQGVPSSSSTSPGLVVRMLEDLQVTDGMRVLEVGTGSGYSTALLCHRLGDHAVTSIEVDPAVADQARQALARIGYQPTLVVGDGLAGHPGSAPFDRVIATCSVRRIPAAWLEQVRPEGQILVTVTGWLHAFGLARLTLTDRGTAEGRFLTDDVSLMIARSQASPTDLGDVSRYLDRDTVQRAATIGTEILDDPTGRFLAQLAAPYAVHARMSVGDGPEADYLFDARHDAHAELIRRPDGTTTVRQTGQVKLWDAIEDAFTAWRRGGAPGVDQFRIRASPITQTVWIDGTPGAAWSLC